MGPSLSASEYIIDIVVYSADEALGEEGMVNGGSFDIEASLSEMVVSQVYLCTSEVSEAVRDWVNNLGPRVTITQDSLSNSRIVLHVRMSSDGHFEVQYEVLKSARKARAFVKYVDKNGNIVSPPDGFYGVKDLKKALAKAVQCAAAPAG